MMSGAPNCVGQIDPAVWSAVLAAMEHKSVSSIVVKLQTIVHSENIGQAMLARLICTSRPWEGALMDAVSIGLWEIEGTPLDLRDALSQMTPDNAWRATVFAAAQCMAQGLFEGSPHLVKEYLRHAWATAIGTSELVSHSDTPQRSSFAAGIFHNIGYPILANLRTQEHHQLRLGLAGTHIALHEMEQQQFDFNHQVVGALFSQVAMLSDRITSCCAQHHFDGFISDPLVAAVRLSDHIAHQVGCSMGIGNSPPNLPSHLLTDIGVDEQSLAAIVQKVAIASGGCSRLVISA